MREFAVRDVSPDHWRAFRARAERDGWHLQALFRQLIDDYAHERLSPSMGPMPAPWRGLLNARCPHCGNAVTVSLRKSDVASVLQTGTVPCPHCSKPLPIPDDDLANLSSWARTANRPGEQID